VRDLNEHARHQRLHVLELLAGPRQRRGDRCRRGAEPLMNAAPHRRGVADHGPCRRHQLAIAADQGVPCLRRPRLPCNDQRAPAAGAHAIAHAPARITQRSTGALHCPRQHAHAVLAAASRPSDSAHSFLRQWCRCEIDVRASPRTLGDLDDVAMQLLDDVRSERARDFQDRLRVWHFLGIDAGEGAIDQIGADLTFEIVIAPIEEMLQDQHPQHDIGRGPRASASPTLRPARLERLDDRINHGLVLEQCVDPSATTPATACARRARTLRTDCARAGDAEPCPLL